MERASESVVCLCERVCAGGRASRDRKRGGGRQADGRTDGITAVAARREARVKGKRESEGVGAYEASNLQ